MGCPQADADRAVAVSVLKLMDRLQHRHGARFLPRAWRKVHTDMNEILTQADACDADCGACPTPEREAAFTIRDQVEWRHMQEPSQSRAWLELRRRVVAHAAGTSTLGRIDD